MSQVVGPGPALPNHSNPLVLPSLNVEVPGQVAVVAGQEGLGGPQDMEML